MMQCLFSTEIIAIDVYLLLILVCFIAEFQISKVPVYRIVRTKYIAILLPIFYSSHTCI